MAKISAKKSDLKTIANRIIVSPSTAIVSDLKFKRKKDFKTFIKWIESSNKALAGIKLPSKKEVEKLGKGPGGSNWLPALLALLGIGALAALNKDKDKDKDKDADGVDAEDTGVTIPKPLQGPNLTSALDITRQLNDPNIRKNNNIKRINNKIDVKNKNTLKTNLKNAKIKSNWIKNLKSNTLRNKFWKKGGIKPNVINLGERMKSVQLKHGSKLMKVGSGTFSATKAQAPLIPDSLNKNIIKKQPLLKTSFKTNIKNLFKPSSLKSLGKGLILDYAAQKLIVEPIDHLSTKGFRHLGKKLLDKQVKKHGAPKVLSRLIERKEKLVSKKPVNWAVEFLTGQNEFNQKFLKEVEFDIDYIKTKYKDQLNNQSKNIFQSGETTVPFPIITTDMSEKFNLPTIDTNAFTKSSSSESSIPFGLNSDDNPFSDLLLTNLK
tara:strand:- start:1238 stop:2542 length:1305 start_codon:yes stop_codon:yes gene_type:complete